MNQQQAIDKMETGKLYKCIIYHWSPDVKKKHEVILKKVLADEDEYEFRFADDNSELSYDWNVETFEEYNG